MKIWDKNSKNNEGKTPYDLAADAKHLEVCAFFQKNISDKKNQRATRSKRLKLDLS